MSITGLQNFLDQAYSVYHAENWVQERLLGEGYTLLKEQDAWDLRPGGRYCVQRGGSAIAAFRVPEGEAKGFLMSASHCDRPCFKLKENFELTGTYTRAAVEGYGGMIAAPWLDRPLSVAGRVIVETKDGIESKLLNLDRDLLMIPNVAIHMNRQVNDGYKWNPTCDLLPLIGGKDSAGKLWALLEQEAGGKILDYDLFLYLRQKSTVWGVEKEYISSAALDDLECVWGCTEGFLQSGTGESIPLLCVFDSEEVGSSSVQGAASTFLSDVVERVCEALKRDRRQMLAQSFLVSADNAHALHPNHPELSDGANAPILGGGIVLKYSAALRYSTDGLSAGIFRRVCAMAGVPVQSFHNRADMPGGSTLGHISLSQVSVLTADIGLPQLAMHSCYETAAVQDALDLVRAMAVYYGSTLEVTETGYSLV